MAVSLMWIIDKLSSLRVPKLLRSTHIDILLSHVDHWSRSNCERTLVGDLGQPKRLLGNLPMKISTPNVVSLSTINGVCSSPFAFSGSILSSSLPVQSVTLWDHFRTPILR
ncbi:hypothetical protein PILCRDRAFT_499960 [Piloderma croceum F 1598]|uniref:Uncharacterized protein n=1 Tax=Piloderma croceum (strain F 1598) TaxID=765440 RepID=A0A0C3FQD6_PILCF|nr:hypothetical protein PILCRDRAFT_499960 [Piloderma croceum F 1598]